MCFCSDDCCYLNIILVVRLRFFSHLGWIHFTYKIRGHCHIAPLHELSVPAKAFFALHRFSWLNLFDLVVVGFLGEVWFLKLHCCDSLIEVGTLIKHLVSCIYLICLNTLHWWGQCEWHLFITPINCIMCGPPLLESMSSTTYGDFFIFNTTKMVHWVDIVLDGGLVSKYRCWAMDLIPCHKNFLISDLGNCECCIEGR